MNPQEREQLNHFLQQLTQAQAGQKDAEAEALIGAACARQPDAAYLLVQRALQLEQALQFVQTQAGKLQAELEQSRSGVRGSFLDQANAWGRPPAVQAAPGAAVQSQVQAPPAAAPAASWGSGVLGSVATTAAGVVAGSFLFQGIGNLMAHHQQGTGGSAGAAQPTAASENTVFNNDSDAGALDDADDSSAAADGGDSGDFA